jgi:hypothetical protein
MASLRLVFSPSGEESAIMTMLSVITRKQESEITYIATNADPGEATRTQESM